MSGRRFGSGPDGEEACVIRAENTEQAGMASKAGADCARKRNHARPRRRPEEEKNAKIPEDCRQENQRPGMGNEPPRQSAPRFGHAQVLQRIRKADTVLFQSEKSVPAEMRLLREALSGGRKSAFMLTAAAECGSRRKREIL